MNSLHYPVTRRRCHRHFPLYLASHACHHSMSTSVISPSSPPSDAHQIPLPLSSSSNSNTSAQSLSKEHIASQTAEFLFGSSTTPQPASTPLPPLPSSPSSASASSSDSGDSDFVTGSIITTKEENTINYSSPSQDISDQQTSSYPVNMEYSRSSDGESLFSCFTYHFPPSRSFSN